MQLIGLRSTNKLRLTNPAPRNPALGAPEGAPVHSYGCSAAKPVEADDAKAEPRRGDRTHTAAGARNLDASNHARRATAPRTPIGVLVPCIPHI